VFRLIHPNAVRLAKSLARAKVLAPLLFRQLGTQCWLDVITIVDHTGAVVGTYDKDGWHPPASKLARDISEVMEDGGLEDGL
jgi:hypothetical protein